MATEPLLEEAASLHAQWVAEARRALAGAAPWRPHLTRPEVLAEAVTAELGEIRSALQEAGLWPAP